jgi:transposase
MSKPKSWRDTVPIHPAADMFPLMSKDELEELATDIKKNGFRNKVAVWDSDNGPILLDGRNRLDAAELAGIPLFDRHGRVDVPHQHYAPPSDPYALVISFNIHRRHLTADQKRELIAKLLKHDPGKSDRQVAKTVGVHHETVAAVREKAEARGEIRHVETRKDSKGRAQPARKAKQKQRVMSLEKEIAASEKESREIVANIEKETEKFAAYLEKNYPTKLTNAPLDPEAAVEARKAAYAAEEFRAAKIASRANTFHRQLKAFLIGFEDTFPAWLAKGEIDEDCARELANALNIVAERLMGFRNDVLAKANEIRAGVDR